MRRVCDLISTLTIIYYVVVVVRKSPKRPHFCADDGKNKHVKTKKKKNTAAVFVVSREKVMSGIRTRGQKRRIGQRDVWDLIVNNDDICFKHIIPRLNSMDLKFLYEVNGETRKLIKRSSREEELKWKCYIEQMSSISTLEFAWENRSLWPSWWGEGETSFCWRVAKTNKLELLKWAREEKKCDWDEETINMAAKQGNMEMVKYCVANECPIGTGTCARVAGNGDLECLKYLREEAKAPWDFLTATWAAENGHLHILEYLVGRAALEGNLNEVQYCVRYECPIDEYACANAALKGHLACLKYLHEKAKAPWDRRTAHWAALNGHLHILKYLVEREFDEFTEWAREDAAKNGHLDCLKYLHETAKVRWTSSRAVRKAFDNAQLRCAKNNAQLKCVHYLLDNNCPIPLNWRIDEDGGLHHPGN